MNTDRTNPYAPPKARVVDPEPTSHGLKRRRVIVMILFAIITLGVYYLIWWYRRRPALNRLNSPKKLALWPLLSLTALYVIEFVVGFANGLAPDSQAVGPSVSLLLSIFQLAVGIVMIIQAFRVKDIIEDHAAPAPNSGPTFGTQVQLSGVMTFFFSIFYLQWAINRYVIPSD